MVMLARPVRGLSDLALSVNWVAKRNGSDVLSLEHLDEGVLICFGYCYDVRGALLVHFRYPNCGRGFGDVCKSYWRALDADLAAECAPWLCQL